MKSIFLTLLLLPLYSSIISQNQLTGLVLSNHQEPIEFASVSVFPINDSTLINGGITKQDGHYIINELKNESYILTVQMLGYQDYTKRINLSSDLYLEPIILSEQSNTLDEIQVVAQQSIIENHLGKRVLRIGKDLTLIGSNALEAIDNIPSVTTTPKGQIQIRGNSNVVIYINGKISGRDPSTLKFISAESLERIEIITNPSAKYDAEGVGGIINLVYKKDKANAVKIELVSNLSLLTDPMYLNPNGGINASWIKDKISFFTNISIDYGKYTDYVNSKRNNFTDDLQHYENLTEQNGLGNVSNALFGFSLDPDSTSSIGLELNYDRWDLKNDIEQKNVFSYLNQSEEQFIFPMRRGELENELWINFSYEKKFKQKKNLKISSTVGGEDEANFSDSKNIAINKLSDDTQRFLKSSDEKERQRYFQTTFDFETPFLNWGTLELGLKADFIRYDIFQKVKLRSDTLQIPDNDFKMNMQKLGAYIIQKKQFKEFEYAIGIRMEQFSSDAFQQAEEKNFTQDYTRFFPSIQLNYLIKEREHTIGVNYTRRINRPGFFDLNPYVSYEDPLNLSTGNPALQPEIADLLEVNYHKEWEKINLDLTLYQRTTKNSIQSIVTPIENNKTLVTSVNIGKENNRGIETQLEFRPNKTLKTSGTFVLYQNSYEDQINEISYNRQSSWSARLTQQWQLKNNWKIVLSEIYRAPSYQIQEKRHEAFYMNIAVSKKFKNNKGRLSLSVRDVFNTRIYKYSLLSSEFEIEHSYKWQTRQVTLGLVYTLIDKKN